MTDGRMLGLADDPTEGMTNGRTSGWNNSKTHIVRLPIIAKAHNALKLGLDEKD